MLTINPTDALLVTDLQNDFCLGGPLGRSLAEKRSFPSVNRWRKHFPTSCSPRIGIRRSHLVCQRAPRRQAVPDHRRALRQPDPLARTTASKTLPVPHSIPRSTSPTPSWCCARASASKIDSYSAFLENDHFTPTGLAGYLRERGLRRLFFCGLAYDFCVRFSAIDGAALDFQCVVIRTPRARSSSPAA